MNGHSTLRFLASVLLLSAPVSVRAQVPAPIGDGPKEGWRLLASDGQGLLAIGLSGERIRLFESAKPIDSLAYDRAQELVWFVSEKRLWVLDLRAEGYRPILIAAGLPVVEFEISGWSHASAGLEDYEGAGRYNLELRRYPIIALQSEPKVEVGEVGDTDRTESAVSPALIKRIVLVGVDWLKAQSSRSNMPPSEMRPVSGRVTLPGGDTHGCDESSLCGTSSQLGGTALELVIASHACGDGCYTGCLIYDRKAKRFASPANGLWVETPDTSSCDVAMAPDDGQYFVGRTHCQVTDRVVACREYVDVVFLGWVASKVVPPLAPSVPHNGSNPRQPVGER